MGSKIGVAAFGRHDAIAIVVPNKQGLTEAGACREQAACAARFGFAFVQNEKLFRIEILDALSPSAKVIQELDMRNVQFLREDSSVDRPGKIRRANAIVNNRPGDAESRGFNFFSGKMRSGLAGKLLGDQIKLCEILAAKTLAINRGKLAVFFQKKREVAFGAANIASEDQRCLLKLLNRIKTAKAHYGLYHERPSRSSRLSDSLGPQLPAEYSGTLALLAALQTSRMGSTRDQAASTLSARSKRVASPRTQSFTRVA